MGSTSVSIKFSASSGNAAANLKLRFRFWLKGDIEGYPNYQDLTFETSPAYFNVSLDSGTGWYGGGGSLAKPSPDHQKRVLNAIEIFFESEGASEICINELIIISEELSIEDGEPFESISLKCKLILTFATATDAVFGTLSGAGFHDVGSLATLAAAPFSGWKFLRWELHCGVNGLLSYDNPYDHPVPSKQQQTIYAVFEKTEELPEEPNEPEDPEEHEPPETPEPTETPRSLPPVVELREGFVPMRIPSVVSGSYIYSHTALIELHEKRAKGDSRLFYAYELLVAFP
jgi:hypothetical protein